MRTILAYEGKRCQLDDIHNSNNNNVESIYIIQEQRGGYKAALCPMLISNIKINILGFRERSIRDTRLGLSTRHR